MAKRSKNDGFGDKDLNKSPIRLKVAILGSGNIGTDLLIKVTRSPYLECTAFVGRNESSLGLARAKSMGVSLSTKGIEWLEANPDQFDIVCDATCADGHHLHETVLRRVGKITVDLTPAQVGQMVVPAINIDECLKHSNVNLVTCGGQAAIPLACAISRAVEADRVEYVEAATSINSKSAGPATRTNLEEDLQTTEKGLVELAGVLRAKASLELSSLASCVNMQTTVTAKFNSQANLPDLQRLKLAVGEMVEKVKTYVPGYELIEAPSFVDGLLVVRVCVRGRGDYLPTYAGNLDIINCAAVAVLERHALELAQSPAGYRVWAAGLGRKREFGYERSVN